MASIYSGSRWWAAREVCRMFGVPERLVVDRTGSRLLARSRKRRRGH